MKEKTEEQQEFLPRVKRLTVTGLAYSVAVVLPAILSVFVVGIATAIAGEAYANEEWFLYLNFLVPQVGLAATAVLFLRGTKTSFKRFYRPCHWRFFLLAVALQFGLFSLTQLNILFQEALEGWGLSGADVTLPSMQGAKILPVLLVVGVLPAIFEETIFRGVIGRNLQKEGWGAVWSILISAALFSLYHSNPVQTIYQFLCGAAYALVAVRSGSVLPTMLAHFLNNAVIIFVTAFEFDLLSLPFVICSAVVLVGTLCYLIFFEGRGTNFGKPNGGKYFFGGAAAGIILCIITWIVVLCQP